jgi:hypothetical protein
MNRPTCDLAPPTPPPTCQPGRQLQRVVSWSAPLDPAPSSVGPFAIPTLFSARPRPKGGGTSVPPRSPRSAETSGTTPLPSAFRSTPGTILRASHSGVPPERPHISGRGTIASALSAAPSIRSPAASASTQPYLPHRFLRTCRVRLGDFTSSQARQASAATPHRLQIQLT